MFGNFIDYYIMQKHFLRVVKVLTKHYIPASIGVKK
jgi:hypothetical protein